MCYLLANMSELAFCDQVYLRCCWIGMFCDTVAGSLQPCHSQLTLYARSVPNAVCVARPEDEQAMLETFRGL
jgi:hypothetical protein